VRARPAATASGVHHTGGTAPVGLAPLLDLDPALGTLLPPARRRAALQQLVVPSERIRAGAWDPASMGAGAGDLGLLIVDGLLAREVLAENIISTELLGAGDVIRAGRPPGESLLRVSVQWSVLAEARIAVLVTHRLAAFPELLPALAERMLERSERLAVEQAISKLTGVDRRLVALFRHLAERWGRVTIDGVAIPLALSHRMLAQLVGARRPSVSTALAELARDGVLVRAADGTWLLSQPRRLPESVTRLPRRAAPAHLHPVAARSA
jgi:CRP/FNR family transcriptional regulator, cyclic AMP receptor protein